MERVLGEVRSALPGVVWPGLPANPGPVLLALLLQLEETQWLSATAILERQREQAAALLRHARDTVPFYRARLGDLRLDGSFDPEAFRRIPLVTRRNIQEAGKAMVSSAAPVEHGPLHATESSGSTAEPIVQVGNQVTGLFWQALLMREHLWHRRDFSGKLAAIRSKTKSVTLADWGPPAAMLYHTGPCAVLDLSLDLDEQVRWVEREDPDYLVSFGTNILLLARRSLELGVRFRKLREARTYGEALRPETRQVVRDAWGVGVVDCYSSEELGYIALQCPLHEHYHVQSENLLIEVLREDGSPCEVGEVGRVVATTLHNFAMPLVRYANGDYAEVGPPCDCGRGLPVLARILGRQRNMLVRPDGVRHWPSFPSEAWREAAPVRQLQLVQDALDHIAARLVLPRDLTPDEEARLIAIFRECLGYPFRITLQRVEAIERSRSGKFEDFVSRLVE